MGEACTASIVCVPVDLAVAVADDDHVNVFSSADYLACVAEAYFPGRRYALTDYAVVGQTFRLLRIPRAGLKQERVVTWVPFMDFLEPIAGTIAGSLANTKGGPSYLPLVSHGRVTAPEWHATPHPPELQASPLIDFTLFQTWEAFVTHSRSTAHPGFRSQRARQLRKLQEKHGVEFRWHDEDPAALKQLIAWKSQQYQEAGYVDGFQSRALVRLFELLCDRSKLIVTTMRVGGEIVSGHAGMEHDGRFYYWLPAYAKSWGKEGVGSMMIEWMIEASYQKKHREFDFLLGNEPYKWGYATHTRLIGSLGDEPLVQRVWKPLRAALMQRVRKHERAYGELQALKRKASAILLRRS
ncbi:MAG: GNAT family N-acetyltransferase [Deltaproteobacteria bacterium]|nr:GNAT family N-acetyltransferase [Deltaproteobacteria bacterium]